MWLCSTRRNLSSGLLITPAMVFVYVSIACVWAACVCPWCVWQSLVISPLSLYVLTGVCMYEYGLRTYGNSCLLLLFVFAFHHACECVFLREKIKIKITHALYLFSFYFDAEVTFSSGRKTHVSSIATDSMSLGKMYVISFILSCLICNLRCVYNHYVHINFSLHVRACVEGIWWSNASPFVQFFFFAFSHSLGILIFAVYFNIIIAHCFV